MQSTPGIKGGVQSKISQLEKAQPLGSSTKEPKVVSNENDLRQALNLKEDTYNHFFAEEDDFGKVIAQVISTRNKEVFQLKYPITVRNVDLPRSCDLGELRSDVTLEQCTQGGDWAIEHMEPETLGSTADINLPQGAFSYLPKSSSSSSTSLIISTSVPPTRSTGARVPLLNVQGTNPERDVAGSPRWHSGQHSTTSSRPGSDRGPRRVDGTETSANPSIGPQRALRRERTNDDSPRTLGSSTQQKSPRALDASTTNATSISPRHPPRIDLDSSQQSTPNNSPRVTSTSSTTNRHNVTPEDSPRNLLSSNSESPRSGLQMGMSTRPALNNPPPLGLSATIASTKKDNVKMADDYYNEYLSLRDILQKPEFLSKADVDEIALQKKLAIQNLELASDYWHPKAPYDLAYHAYQELLKEDTAENREAAVKYARLAASRWNVRLGNPSIVELIAQQLTTSTSAGTGIVQSQLCVLSLCRGAIEDARRYQKNALTLEYRQIASDIALVYLEGVGKVLKKDVTKAVLLFEDAVKWKDPQGLYEYGKARIEGKLLEQDVAAGFDYIEASANRGNVSALIYLNSMRMKHEYKKNISQDIEKADAGFLNALEAVGDNEAARAQIIFEVAEIYNFAYARDLHSHFRSNKLFLEQAFAWNQRAATLPSSDRPEYYKDRANLYSQPLLPTQPKSSPNPKQHSS